MSENTLQKIVETVTRTPGSSAVEIAQAVGMSKSPITKGLRALERDGEVYREPGGHDGQIRQPDRWYHRTHAQVDEQSTENDAASTEEHSGRLKRGELRSMVLDYLEAHAGSEYGPSQLAKHLDRSAGAIANVLDKAKSDRIVEQTNDKPKRYRHKAR